MPVIRDVMPAFELFQPTSIADTRRPARPPRQRAWLMAGGLDSFDWLKDRIKRPRGGHRPRRRRPSCAASRRPTAASRSAPTPRSPRSRATRWCKDKFALLAEAAGHRRLAADPQPGIDRRQRQPGHALPLLPRRLAVLSRRRQHLLRRHADGGESRARDSRSRSLRRGEPVRHRARADRARRRRWSCATAAANASSPARDFFVGPWLDITRMTALQPGDLLVVDPHSRHVRRQAVLLREGARSAGVGLRRSSTSPRRCRVDGNTIDDARLVVGGVAARPLRLVEVENAIRGRARNEETAQHGRRDRDPRRGAAAPQRLQGSADAEPREARHSRRGCMDFVTWARSPWGEDVLTHISWSLFWASLVGGVLFLARPRRLHAVLAARQARRRPKSIAWKRERQGPAGADSAPLVRGAHVPLGDGGRRCWSLVVHRVPARSSASSSRGSSGTGWRASC